MFFPYKDDQKKLAVSQTVLLCLSCLKHFCKVLAKFSDYKHNCETTNIVTHIKFQNFNCLLKKPSLR